MSERSAKDRYEEINNRVRWAKAMCDVLIADPDVQHIHCEAIAGVAGHLADAMRELESLYQEFCRIDDAQPPEPKKPRLVPIRKAAPADDEPEHAA